MSVLNTLALVIYDDIFNRLHNAKSRIFRGPRLSARLAWGRACVSGFLPILTHPRSNTILPGLSFFQEYPL